MQIGAELGNGELTYPFGLAARVGRDTYSDEWEEEEAYTPQWEMVLQPIRSSSNDPFQVARRVLPMLIAQTLWASCITLASFRYQLWAPPMVHSLLGGVLGLLLAFRTNQAYLRYQQLCTTWVSLATHSLNMARNAAQLDFKLYSAVLRHVIAFPIAIKQSLRGTRNEKEFYTSLWVTELEQIDSRQPVLSILASISMLLRPVKASDDGSGREVALWAKLELDIAEMQSVASRFDSLQLLPPPPSYSLLVSRFLLLWSATLPFPMLSVLPRWCVPPVMFAVAWALYSTEELAQLMEEPCGNPRKPETLPLEQVCESLVMQLKQQVIIQRRLQQRVTDRDWVVEPEDLEGPPAAYVRKETLVPKDDDGIDTSASDSDDENDDEVNDGSSVNVPPPASESR
jgi:predicted membrane chloride channel (bestrophin family)